MIGPNDYEEPLGGGARTGTVEATPTETDGEHTPACEACRELFTVSGVKLCAYHNAVRGYVPVLYLADGRGMNHAGVVGTPPEHPTEPAAGVVDALVALAERMSPAVVHTPGTIDVVVYDETTTAEDIVAMIDRVMPPTSIPPSEAEPPPRPCIAPRADIPVPPFMSTDSAMRKLMPVATGVLKYFPDSQMLKAWISRVGNDKHNPGQPLHWAKEKSADEPDAEVRHMLDNFRGLPADPGLEALAHLGHLASKAWRADADLQRACDEARAAFERGEDWRK